MTSAADAEPGIALGILAGISARTNGSWTSFNPQNACAWCSGTDLETFYALGNSQPSLVARLPGTRHEDRELGSRRVCRRICTTTSKKRLRSAVRRCVQGRRWREIVRACAAVTASRTSRFRCGRLSTECSSTRRSSAAYQNSPNNAAQSPDGIPNYLLRTVPTIIMGVNSKNAISLDQRSRHQPRNCASHILCTGTADFTHPYVELHHREGDLAQHGGARPLRRQPRQQSRAVLPLQQQSARLRLVRRRTRQPLPTGVTSGVVRRPFDNTFWGNIQEYNKTGWSNYNGMEFEIERRYQQRHRLPVVLRRRQRARADDIRQHATRSPCRRSNQFMPGAVPADFDERNRFLNYQRDPSIPKHRVRWNWVADCRSARESRSAGNANGIVDKLIGGWQIAGIGRFRSNYFSLPTEQLEPDGRADSRPTATSIRSRTAPAASCVPGYLWWNGYIPGEPHQQPRCQWPAERIHGRSRRTTSRR